MYRSLRAEFTEAISTALDGLGYDVDDPGIEHPPEGVAAEVASSVAYRLAESAGAPPPQVASEIADATAPDEYEYLGRVTSQGPYVNAVPAPAYDAATVAAARDDDYGTLPATDESVVVEHTSANPTGPVHVGRARNPILGDALARVLSAAGHDVETNYYVNDAGRQIALFTWAFDRFDESDLPDPERESPEYDMVRYYRAGNDFLESADPEAQAAAEDEIEAILQGLESGDDATYERVERVVDTVLEGMTDTLERLPVTFDRFVKETQFMRDGSTDDVIDRLRDSEYSVHEEGAWQLDFPDIEKNLVFVRSDGTSLYSTRDLAHHEWKLANFDRAVTVLGEDHKLQAEQITAALDLLGQDTDRLDQVFYSWVNLPEGGMSTREGTGVDLDDLLDESIERARAEVEDRLADRLRDDDLDEADLDRIAHQVGIGAVRFDVVATQPTKGITFEWERALDFEAQSAPYVQYVHARCCGILDAVEAVPDPDAISASALDDPAAIDLVRTIARFPERVETAAERRRPHVIAAYTRTFAETFNAFYRECPVLDAEGDQRAARIALVAAARQTIANALALLGVPAPESM
ncbi:arginine--tRNA ligase [Halococcoides cellulosivorans]|uniref:Arginine--tRNA ligase n=1 Tax=Halococcoides cellulosivorans TaxID=1679096 RepID=A0A2R4X2R3_9EURY|nr:arginine--tRNA ligase [Halococcoides cellulosivorans]AWB28091.1 arginine--tRNA ligase [Halococcoides cellulosivorans]